MKSIHATVKVELFHEHEAWNGTLTDWSIEVTASGVVEFRDGEPWIDYSTVTYEDEYGREYEPHGTDEDVIALSLMDEAARIRREANMGAAMPRGG